MRLWGHKRTVPTAEISWSDEDWLDWLEGPRLSTYFSTPLYSYPGDSIRITRSMDDRVYEQFSVVVDDFVCVKGVRSDRTLITEPWTPNHIPSETKAYLALRDGDEIDIITGEICSS